MNATIVIMNPARGMIAAETDGGDFVIFELLGGYDVEIGHVVRHRDFTSMGGEKYLNVTTGEVMDVYVQNLCATASQAKAQCLFC